MAEEYRIAGGGGTGDSGASTGALEQQVEPVEVGHHHHASSPYSLLPQGSISTGHLGGDHLFHRDNFRIAPRREFTDKPFGHGVDGEFTQHWTYILKPGPSREYYSVGTMCSRDQHECKHQDILLATRQRVDGVPVGGVRMEEWDRRDGAMVAWEEFKAGERAEAERKLKFVRALDGIPGKSYVGHWFLHVHDVFAGPSQR